MRDSRQSGGRRLMLRLGFSLAVTVGLLGAMEGIARLAGGRVKAPDSRDAPDFLQADPVLGWRPVPGAMVPPDRERLAWEAANGIQTEADEPLSPEGFRDTPLAHPKPAGERRVLSVGDSSVWGHGLGQADTFSQQLQASLGAGVEVINAGVPGYSSFQSHLQLSANRGLGIDGLIVYSMNSDVSPVAGRTDSEHYGQPYVLTLSRVLGASALYQWLLPTAAPTQQEATTFGDRSRVQLDHYLENLRRFADGEPWVIYVVPPLRRDLQRRPQKSGLTSEGAADRAREQLSRQQDHQPGMVEDYRLAMSLAAWEASAPLLDGPALFQGGDADELFVDDVHPSAPGHRLLAEALTPLVQAQLSGEP